MTVQFEECCKYCKFHRPRGEEGGYVVPTVLCCYNPRDITKLSNGWCSKFKIGGENCERRMIEITVKGERVMSKKEQSEMDTKSSFKRLLTPMKTIPKDFLEYDHYYEEN